MSRDRRKTIHIHSALNDKQPTPSSLELGELAVNNSSGNEFISTKNTDNEVVRFSTDETLVTWMEKKAVIPYSGCVDNVHLDTNKSNVEIKLNQVASNNTNKSSVVNGAKDIDGNLVNPTSDDGLTNGAGFAIDMSLYAMNGANPSFSTVTVDNRSELNGVTDINGSELDVDVTNVNIDATDICERATDEAHFEGDTKTSIGTACNGSVSKDTDIAASNSLTITSNTITETSTSDTLRTVGGDLVETIDGDKVETIDGSHTATTSGNYEETINGNHSEIVKGSLVKSVSDTISMTAVNGASIYASNGDVGITSMGGSTNIMSSDDICATATDALSIKGGASTNVGTACNGTVSQSTNVNASGALTMTANTINETSNGNTNISVGGSLTETVSGGKTENISGGKSETINGGSSMSVNGTLSISSTDDASISSSNGSANITAKDNVSISSTSDDVCITANGDAHLMGGVSTNVGIACDGTSTFNTSISAKETITETAKTINDSAVTVNVHGSNFVNIDSVGGTTIKTTNGNTVIATTGNTNISSTDDTNISANKNIDINADKNVNVTADGGIGIKSSDNMCLTADGDLYLAGKSITHIGKTCDGSISNTIVYERKPQGTTTLTSTTIDDALEETMTRSKVTKTQTANTKSTTHEIWQDGASRGTIETLNIQAFDDYSASTQNIINNNYNTLNTKIDNSVTTLQNQISTKVDNSTFTSTVNNLQTQIDDKVDWTTYRNYTGETKELIDDKVDWTTYRNYTGETKTQIDARVTTTTFNTTVNHLESEIEDRVDWDTYNGYTSRTDNRISIIEGDYPISLTSESNDSSIIYTLYQGSNSKGTITVPRSTTGQVVSTVISVDSNADETEYYIKQDGVTVGTIYVGDGSGGGNVSMYTGSTNDNYNYSFYQDGSSIGTVNVPKVKMTSSTNTSNGSSSYTFTQGSTAIGTVTVPSGGSGSGSGYVLPVATNTILGGVKANAFSAYNLSESSFESMRKSDPDNGKTSDILVTSDGHLLAYSTKKHLYITKDIPVNVGKNIDSSISFTATAAEYQEQSHYVSVDLWIWPPQYTELPRGYNYYALLYSSLDGKLYSEKVPLVEDPQTGSTSSIRSFNREMLPSDASGSIYYYPMRNARTQHGRWTSAQSAPSSSNQVSLIQSITIFAESEKEILSIGGVVTSGNNVSMTQASSTTFSSYTFTQEGNGTVGTVKVPKLKISSAATSTLKNYTFTYGGEEIYTLPVPISTGSPTPVGGGLQDVSSTTTASSAETTYSLYKTFDNENWSKYQDITVPNISAYLQNYYNKTEILGLMSGSSSTSSVTVTFGSIGSVYYTAWVTVKKAYNGIPQSAIYYIHTNSSLIYYKALFYELIDNGSTVVAGIVGQGNSDEDGYTYEYVIQTLPINHNDELVIPTTVKLTSTNITVGSSNTGSTGTTAASWSSVAWIALTSSTEPFSEDVTMEGLYAHNNYSNARYLYKYSAGSSGNQSYDGKYLTVKSTTSANLADGFYATYFESKGNPVRYNYTLMWIVEGDLKNIVYLTNMAVNQQGSQYPIVITSVEIETYVNNVKKSQYSGTNIGFYNTTILKNVCQNPATYGLS